MATKLSMPVITLTSPSRTGISHPNKTTSFPTYMDGVAEETFVLKLGVPTAHFLGKNTTGDREIDVFDAQKYFNEGLNRSPKVDPKKLLSSDRLHKKDEPVDSVAPKTSTLRSIRSESSTNSRTTLLHNNPRRSLRKGFLASIGCSCSCADKNSVDVDDFRESQPVDKTRDYLLKKTGNQAAKIEEEDQVKRNLENRKNSLSLEKKLNVMSWDAVLEEIKISSEMKQDDDSDGSSDLFEIESLSKDRPFLSRQASDGLSGACYAPSEASVEWSVVTASAADVSVVSDSEEFGLDKLISQKGGQHLKIKEIPKGILSGCKSQKAVSVAGDAHRTNQPGIFNGRMRLRAAPMSRFHDESTPGGFSAKIRPQSLDSGVRLIPPQPRPGNAARLLYT